MKVLLVEDDNLVANSISLALDARGYIIEWLRSGEEAELLVTTAPYDVIILDLGLPDKDGLGVLKGIREKNIRVPVLILTARDSYEERIDGLDAGANDYLVKPFHMGELEARIRALLRLTSGNIAEIQIGELTFDTVKRVVRRADQIIELSPREYQVLEILAHNHGSLVTKQRMAASLSDWEAPVTYNAMDIVIHRLRKKLDQYGVKLQTIRGLGFLVE
jgi:DNA-binding response OmpR family regulator